MNPKLLLCLALVLGGGFPVSSSAGLPAAKTNAGDTQTYISTIHMVDARTGWAWTDGLEGQQLLLHTDDGGQSWRDRTPSAFPYCSGCDCFLDSRTAWVSTLDRKTDRGGLLRTTDGGKSWSVLIKPGTAPYGFLTEGSDLHFFNAVHGVLNTADFSAGSREECFYETWDGGRNWKLIDLVQPGGPYAGEAPGAVYLSDIAPETIGYCPPANVVITHGDMDDEKPKDAVRLSVSTNLGKTWRSLNLPLPSEKYREGLVCCGIPRFLDARHGWLPARLAAEGTSHIFAWTALAFYETRDGGRTWKPRPGVLEGGTNTFGDERQFADIVSSKIIFTRCGANLYVTRNGARSWQKIKPNIDFARGVPNGGVSQIDFVDARHGWAVVYDTFHHFRDSKYYLYKTSDGGKNWTEMPLKILR